MNYKYTWAIYPIADRYADKDQDPEWFKNADDAIRSAEWEWELQFTNTERQRYKIVVLAVVPCKNYDPEDEEFSDPWEMQLYMYGADVVKEFKL